MFIIQATGVNVFKLFSLSVTNRLNKLDHLSLAIFLPNLIFVGKAKEVAQRAAPLG